MARVHFLNVGNGDCIIIEHVSGRITIIDICSGNLRLTTQERLAKALALPTVMGNFRMCEHPTNPLDYLSSIGVEEVWRFVLSHPDMDHLDGFDNLCSLKRVLNYWDSGVRKDKPDFAGSPYNEDDWDRYERVRDGKEGVRVLSKLAGSQFSFANRGEGGAPGGDGLSILAPDKELVTQANEDGDTNDGSYVVLYRSAGGKILFPGDAHDATWQFVLDNYRTEVEDCSILVAPHHGRKSSRDYRFLDTVRPQLTLFGCAPSEQLAYDAWNSRRLAKITNNQAGNVVMEIGDKVVDVYVENATFAQKLGANLTVKNNLGYIFIARVTAEA